MTRLLLIRHAPTDHTGPRLSGRLPGISLSEEGQRQAEALGEHLRGAGIRRVYTSPLERTADTALAVARHHRLSPIPHDGLLEVDYGRWAGRTFGVLRRTRLWRQLFVAPSRVRFPDGESLAEAQARAVRACEEVAAAVPRGTVALVTHADIIKALLAHYLGLHLDLYQRLEIAPASVSVVHLDERDFPVVSVVNHLVSPDRFAAPQTPPRKRARAGKAAPGQRTGASGGGRG